VWVKIDDRFDEHRKFQKIRGSAGFLWLKCLAYCNRNLTDGHIPRGVAEEKSFGLDRTSPDSLPLELVEAGLWENTPTGFYFHDYPKYQFTKRRIEERSAQKQAAGQAGGRASAQARAQAKSKPVSRIPVPVVPVPVPVSEKDEEKDKDPVPASRSRMVKPTLEEVSAYCEERAQKGKPRVDPEEWMGHYESNGWRVGRNPMKSWRATFPTWEGRARDNGARRRGSTVSASEVIAFGRKLKEEEMDHGKS